jgi:hypothetical protein
VLPAAAAVKGGGGGCGAPAAARMGLTWSKEEGMALTGEGECMMISCAESALREEGEESPVLGLWGCEEAERESREMGDAEAEGRWGGSEKAEAVLKVAPKEAAPVEPKVRGGEGGLTASGWLPRDEETRAAGARADTVRSVCVRMARVESRALFSSSSACWASASAAWARALVREA